MDLSQPLRYRISDVHQLKDCESNTSRDLKIHITDFIQDTRISGVRISLKHKVFGELFATVIHSSGTIYDDGIDKTSEMSISAILKELSRYGYHIEYIENKQLSGELISYLMTLNQLKFEKLRILNVWSVVNDTKRFSPKIVAFNSEQNPNWLNNAYAESESRFKEALANGSAMNLTELSQTQNFNWNWLFGWVASIDDILRENALR